MVQPPDGALGVTDAEHPAGGIAGGGVGDIDGARFDGPDRAGHYIAVTELNYPVDNRPYLHFLHPRLVLEGPGIFYTQLLSFIQLWKKTHHVLSTAEKTSFLA